jgi:putative ABC transport system substrate-binding protein
MFVAEPLTVTPDPFIVLGKFAAKHKIPIGGALMSAGGYDSIFGVNVENEAVGKQAAPLLDKIFKGIPAGTLPVVSAENYIQVNYKAAQEQGFTVPEGMLNQANEVIH